jgi:hypothetical protein
MMRSEQIQRVFSPVEVARKQHVNPMVPGYLCEAGPGRVRRARMSKAMADWVVKFFPSTCVGAPSGEESSGNH